MHQIHKFIVTLDQYLGSSSWFPMLLVGTGLFFTIYLKFPQIRYFRHALRIVTGRYEKETMPGDTTHFQSLSTALSGTVGTGNIGGVGLAIFLGGPAALFWMWVTAFFGMTTKFVECTLSHKYRRFDPDGSVAGGPMYYMEQKLKLKPLAVLFAVGTLICAFGTGNMPQINNIATSMKATTGIPGPVTGGVLAIFLAAIILGGIRRIAKVTQVLVPFMCVAYVVGALMVIVSNAANLAEAIVHVFSDLWNGAAATGGFLGATFATTFTKGVGRGLYSNEAGQGSAAIAHAAAKADEPVSEGMVAILEPFIDTLVVCTLTGLTILASGVWTEKMENQFAPTDLIIVTGQYHENNRTDAARLTGFLTDNNEHRVHRFSGAIEVIKGIPTTGNYTILHARSIAEDVHFKKGGTPFTGAAVVKNGRLVDRDISLRGRSRVHSAVLTSFAFQKSGLGNLGPLIVSVGLLLFAFSTVISWSYYGDRAVTYLFGPKLITPYRIAYVIAFFGATLMDTTLIWEIAAVAIVLMTLPNLIGILLLHRDMKESVAQYWRSFDARP